MKIMEKIERIAADVFVGAIIAAVCILAVQWINETMQARLDAAGRPPIEMRR
jgi:hypothetical protein